MLTTTLAAAAAAGVAVGTPGRPMPDLVDYSDAHLVIRGFVTPLAVLLTVLTNGLVCAVLLQPTMRNVTNVLLVALACADTLTGLMPLPHYVYFYTGGRHGDWMPYSWCASEPMLTDHLPTAFHTTSVWLTVALAVQR